MENSKESWAISPSDSSKSANSPPISPVHIDFDDLKNDILEMENSNPQAAFDQLLSNFHTIADDVNGDTNAHDANQTNTKQNGNASNADGEASNDAVSTTSTNATVDTAKSNHGSGEGGGGGGIKLVPIASLMQSTDDSSQKANEKKTSKCHSVSSASVEELSSETTCNDDDDDEEDVEFSKSRHKRKTKYKKDLKERFRKLREKAQAKRPNYAERSNSEESDDNSDNDNSEDSSAKASTKKSSKKHRTANAKSSTPKNIYGATVLLNKLPLSNMETLLYKYDLIEIRDRHQKILASRPRTHRNEVHSHISILNKNKSHSLFALWGLHIAHSENNIVKI